VYPRVPMSDTMITREEIDAWMRATDKIGPSAKDRLLSELISMHHPMYKDDIVLKNHLLLHPKDFNLTHLIEQLGEIISDGLYRFIDGRHRDYTDDSDMKTGTLHLCDKYGGNADITNVRSPGGTLKKGAIRSVIVNKLENKLHFLFIPTDSVHMLMHVNGDPNNPIYSTSIRLRYSKKKKMFTTLKKYNIIEFDNYEGEDHMLNDFADMILHTEEN